MIAKWQDKPRSLNHVYCCFKSLYEKNVQIEHNTIITKLEVGFNQLPFIRKIALIEGIL